jgi:hypothetical protein
MRIARSKKLPGRLRAVIPPLDASFRRKEDAKMILKPNVPKRVRNWAACQIRIRSAENVANRLAAGQPTTMSQFGSLKALGRQRFVTEVAAPLLHRLKRQLRRYRSLAAALESDGDPRRHLLDRPAILDLIGTTLNYPRKNAVVFETMRYCSPDGEKLFGMFHPNGLDALELLGLGYGTE